MSAKIYLTRDRALRDFFRRYRVMIDGEEHGRIERGGTFECSMSPGWHSLQLRIDWCGSNTIELDVLDQSVVRFECGSNQRLWRMNATSSLYFPHEWIRLCATRGYQ